VLVAGLELAELTAVAVILEVLVTVLDNGLSPNEVDAAAGGYGGLTVMLVSEFVTMLEDIWTSTDVDAEDGEFDASSLVLVMILVLPLVSEVIVELLTGATMVGEIALEAIGKLVIVVDKVEGEELIAAGRVSLLHCMLW
jgi:hypothetical protein